MKQQLQPKKISIGDVFYSCEASSWDDGTTSVDIDEHHVRCMRMFSGTLNFYITKKSILTHNGMDWKASIPSYCRRAFAIGERLPEGIYTTKAQAVKYAIHKTKSYINQCEFFIKDPNSTWFTKEDIPALKEDLKDYQKELKLLKGRYTRLTKKKKK